MKRLKSLISMILAVVMLWTSVVPASAQANFLSSLPTPGTLVTVSPQFFPVSMSGIHVYPDNPLKFDFLLDKGSTGFKGDHLKNETARLVKYFLTALTVPDDDLWVNLSPVERERIMPKGFDKTLMGKVLLEQDYLLKQLAASMTYPKHAAGADFWKRVYEKAYEKYGTTEIPVDALNKVWIVPAKADVFAYPQGAVVLDARLDVMMEKDYQAVALKDSSEDGARMGGDHLYAEVFKEVFLPELKREVNEGKQFAALRQVYQAIVLAAWYRKHLKTSLLSKVFVGQGKVQDVLSHDMKMKERVYQQYLEAFRRGVYKFIQEEKDPYNTTETLPRKYFSGGVTLTHLSEKAQVYHEIQDFSLLRQRTQMFDSFVASANLAVVIENGKTLKFPDTRLMMAENEYFSGDDRAMVSSRLKKTLLAFGITMMLAFSSLGNPGQAAAADFKTSPSGELVAVVAKGDSVGSIVEQVRVWAKSLNKAEYKSSALSKSMWSPDNLVKQVSTKKIIKPNDEIIIPSHLIPAKILEKMTDIPVTAKAKAKVSTASLKQAPALAQEKFSAVSQEPELLKVPDAKTMAPVLNQADVVLKKRVELWGDESVVKNSTFETARATLSSWWQDLKEKKENIILSWGIGGSKIINGDNLSTEVIQDEIKESWGTWALVGAVAAAVAGGVGFMRRGRGKDHKPSRNIPSSDESPTFPAPSSETALEDDSDRGTPMPGFGFIRVKGEPNSKVSKVVTSEEVKEAVSADKPNAPAKKKDVFAQLGIKVVTENDVLPEKEFAFGLKPEHKDFKRMDVVGFLIGAGLSALALDQGADATTVGSLMIALPFVTRLALLVQLWWHEGMGHLRPAMRQGVKARDALKPSNITVNWSLADWGRALVPGFVPSKPASVNLPEGSLNREATDKVRRSGFVTTVVFSTIAGALLAGVSIYYHLLTMLPLFGPWIAASALAIIYAFKSDVKHIEPAGDCEFGCGVFGVEYIAPNGDNDYYPEWLQEGMRNLMLNLIIRGGQEAGLATMGVKGDALATAHGIVDGEIMPFIAKVMKAKRGGGELPVALNEEFKRIVKKLKRQGINPAPFVRFVDGHVRFATGGKVVLEAAHPHQSVQEMRRIWVFNESGEYVLANLNKFSIIQANGDNDYYNILGERLSTSEIRDFFSDLYQMPRTYNNGKKDKDDRKYMEALPPGDTPPVALQVLYHHTMGDWMGASHFAFVEKVNINLSEVRQTILSYEERKVLGNFFDEVYARHIKALLNAVPKKRDMTTKDLWVDPARAGSNPRLFKEIEALRQDLKASFRREINGNSPLGAVVRNWPRSSENIVDDFIDTAIGKFFTGSRFEATREFMERAEGTYGLKVKMSTEFGVTLVSQGQGISIGFSNRNKMLGFSSEHTTLLSMFGNRGMLDGILALNSEGRGQIADLYLNKDAGDPIEIRVYGVAQGRFLDPEDLADRMMLVSPDNKYFSPLVGYLDPRFVTDDDVNKITAETKEANEAWDDSDSFNRQSSSEFVRKLASRYIEQYLRQHSLYYGVARGVFYEKLSKALQTCDAASCSAAEMDRRRLIFIRKVQADKTLVDYLLARLDYLLGTASDIIAGKLIDKRITEDDLYREKEAVDETLKNLMDYEIEAVLPRLLEDNMQFLQAWKSEQDSLKERAKEKELNIAAAAALGSGDVDLGVFGYEIPLWLAEDMQSMWQTLFPQMKVLTGSSNKVMKLNGPAGLGRRSVGMFISKSGATFPTKGGLELLKDLMPDNLFAMTGRVDTLLGMSLGQKLMPDAPFSKRLFVTGKYFPAETSTVAEAALFAHMINLVLDTARQMKELFPHSKPWGLSMTDEDYGRLAKLRFNMVDEARSLTGRNADGSRIQSKVNQALEDDGALLGKTIAETPLVGNIFMRAFVLGIFWFGAPIENTVNWIMPFLDHGFGGVGGTFSSPLGFAVHTSDFLLTMFMGWFATTYVYRNFFSKRTRYARLGRPTVVFGDIPMLHQSSEQMVSKLSALALGSMDVEVHGGNAQDHFVARFGHRIRRGTLLFFGLPSRQESADEVKRAMRQSKGVVNSILPGWLSRYFPNTGIGGAEVFSVGRGELNDPDATDHHINLGEQKDLEGASELVSRFNEISFDAFGRLVAYKVLFNKAFRWATTWRVGPFVWQAWNQAWTYSRTGVHTTASPVIGTAHNFKQWLKRLTQPSLPEDVREQLTQNLGSEGTKAEINRREESIQAQTIATKKQEEAAGALLKGEYVQTSVDAAEKEAINGGLDFRGKWLEPRLNVKGETEAYYQGVPLNNIPIKGVIVDRIEIAPVEVSAFLMRLS